MGDVKANKFYANPYRGCSYSCLHILYDFCQFSFIYRVLPFTLYCNERIVSISSVIARPFVLCSLFVLRDVSVNMCCIYKKRVVFNGRKNILCSGIAQSGKSLKEPAWSGVWAPAKKSDVCIVTYIHADSGTTSLLRIRYHGLFFKHLEGG
jgi:hypothetical protein